MIWIFTAVLLFGLGCWVNDEEAWIPLAIFGSMSIVIFLVTIGVGVTIVPELEARREKVISLQGEIETIKDARYSGIESGSLVGGALDNAQQSKALSEYITLYATEKAGFNEELKSRQLKYQIWILRWVGCYAFVDKRILEIESIK